MFDLFYTELDVLRCITGNKFPFLLAFIGETRDFTTPPRPWS